MQLMSQERDKMARALKWWSSRWVWNRFTLAGEADGSGRLGGTNERR
jgi:hypothetical protein